MSVTTTLLPNGTLTLAADWAVSGTEPTAHQALALDDGVTSIVTASTHTGQILEVDMDALPALAANIDLFTGRTSFQGAAGGTLDFYTRLAGVDGAVGISQTGAGGYVTHNGTMARPGGGPWSAANVNAASFRCADNITSGAGAINVSYMAWLVAWSPSPGDFAAFVGSLVPWLGVAIPLSQMYMVAGAVLAASGGRHRIGTESFRTLFEDLHRPRRRYACQS